MGFMFILQSLSMAMLMLVGWREVHCRRHWGISALTFARASWPTKRLLVENRKLPKSLRRESRYLAKTLLGMDNALGKEVVNDYYTEYYYDSVGRSWDVADRNRKRLSNKPYKYYQMHVILDNLRLEHESTQKRIRQRDGAAYFDSIDNFMEEAEAHAKVIREVRQEFL